MKTMFALLIGALAVTTARAAGDPELLEAEQAFALTVRARDAQTIEASWRIADGYYMYRDKFRFESLDPAVTLRPAVIPPGKKKDDPGFGIVETYSKSVTIALPLARRDGATSARLRITSQGCNEPVGVCYPPVVSELSVPLPPLKAAATGGVTSLKDLAGLIAPSPDQELLPPDQAFRLSTAVRDTGTVDARLQIAPGHYLYRDKIKVALTRADGVRLGPIELPRGEIKQDPTFGRTEILRDQVAFGIPLARNGAAAADVELEIGYQGCADRGICYPPEKKKVSLRLPAAGEAPAVAATTAAPDPDNGHFKAVLGAFIAGLLLTFTPCVLPMIPILSGVIVRSGDQTISKLRGGLLSYSYVLGTAITYTAAGVLAGATGGQLQAYFQNPWAIGTFATILGLLALSMFGLFELQMPSFVQSKLHYHTHKVRGGTFLGAFILGLVSALIVGACVSPVLISILGVAITNGDPALGGTLMFAMAHGQGVALVAVGVGAGFLLPKAGPWMDRVKQVFGVMLLGVAIYLLGYLPQVPVLLLWSVLLIVTAVYLGATQSLSKDATGWQYLWKGLGTFLLLWGVVTMFGGLLGERDVLKPLPFSSLAALTAGSPAAAASAPATELFHRSAGLKEIQETMARARADGKPVILDFYASWCTDCVRMEKTTFLNPRVRESIGRFVLLQADVTANDDTSNAIKKHFGVFGPPAVLFFGPDGGMRKELNFYGYRSAEEFLALLGRV